MRYSQVEASERLTAQKEQTIQELQKTLTSVEEVAREKASAESKKLEAQLGARNKAVKELEKAAAAAEEAHAKELERLRAANDHILASRSHIKSQLATYAAMLSTTRAAGAHGGYFFAAAPTLQKDSLNMNDPRAPFEHVKGASATAPPTIDPLVKAAIAAAGSRTSSPTGRGEWDPIGSRTS